MKSHLKIVVASAVLGVATTAAGQTPPAQHPFIERHKQMQMLVTGSAYVKPPPVFRDTPDAPVGQATFSDRFAKMQRDSGYTYAFAPEPKPAAQAAAAPARNESFTDRFRAMQAASSNSGQFGFEPGSTSEIASEAPSTLVVARRPRGVMPPAPRQ